jgi:hypothetical protein
LHFPKLSPQRETVKTCHLQDIDLDSFKHDISTLKSPLAESGIDVLCSFYHQGL